LGGVKRFKSHHWFSYFFDKSMVLFDNIIQIFNLAYIKIPTYKQFRALAG
jgi:hypothetical protein